MDERVYAPTIVHSKRLDVGNSLDELFHHIIGAQFVIESTSWRQSIVLLLQALTLVLVSVFSTTRSH